MFYLILNHMSVTLVMLRMRISPRIIRGQKGSMEDESNTVINSLVNISCHLVPL